MRDIETDMLLHSCSLYVANPQKRGLSLNGLAHIQMFCTNLRGSFLEEKNKKN